MYGYLPQSVRQQVCELVDILEQDEDIARIYELWYQAKCAVYNTYTDNDPTKKPLSQEEAFKPIRNALIREANALGAQLHKLGTDEIPETDEVASTRKPPKYHDTPHGSDASTKPVTPVKTAPNRTGAIATSVARLGKNISQTFRNNFYDQVDKSPMSVDRRLQREIEAKKRGQNLSM